MSIEFYQCGDCKHFKEDPKSTFWGKGECTNPKCAVLRTQADWTPAEAHLNSDEPLETCVHEVRKQPCFEPQLLRESRPFNIMELLREIEALELLEGIPGIDPDK